MCATMGHYQAHSIPLLADTCRMFLFNKRTRKVIRFLWAILATLIILSMVLAFSGFSYMSVTSTPAPSRPPIQATPVEISTSSLEETLEGAPESATSTATNTETTPEMLELTI